MSEWVIDILVLAVGGVGAYVAIYITHWLFI